MDATSLPPAAMATLAPAASPPSVDTSESDQGFWEALASATDSASEDGPVPAPHKDDKSKDSAAVAAIAAWVPPVLVTGFPMPTLPTVPTIDTGAPRIFGSPSGIIRGSEAAGFTTVGVVAPADLLSTFDELEVELAEAVSPGVQAALDALTAATADAAPVQTDVAVDQTLPLGPALPTLPLPSTSAGAFEIAPSTSPTLPTTAGSSPIADLTSQAPAAQQTVADPEVLPESPLAADPIALDRPGSTAPADLADSPLSPNTAAIAAGIAIASGQGPTGTQGPTSIEVQATQAAAAQLIADGDPSSPSATPVGQPTGAPAETAANLAPPISVVPPTAAATDQQGAGLRPRFEFRVTDDGVEPVAANQAGGTQANDGFANMLSAASGTPTGSAAPLTATAPVAPTFIDVQARALLEKVVEQASLLRYPDRTEMNLELTPPNLGTVHLHLTQSATSGLTVQMQADDQKVQQMLVANIEQLTARLHEQGHTVAVDLRWDRGAGSEAPDRGYQDDTFQREPGEAGADPDSPTDDVPTLRSDPVAGPLTPTQPDRRVDYRA